MKKVLIFIVAYQAEDFIESVLERIKAQIKFKPEFEILMIDDASTDRTFEIAERFKSENRDLTITNLYNPINQGYGGNQQIGYQFAIENGFEVVVMLHGDGQYPPELIHEMTAPILDGSQDVMLGSRMVNKKDALTGGMPLYKWIGNQVLTWVENRLLGQHLSEYHTGFRAYSVKALEQVPFAYCSRYFDFDTDILIQLSDNDFRIGEIPIPTKYGDEICRVNGMKYAWLILKACVQSRIMRLGLFYNPKFDYCMREARCDRYSPKFTIDSPHRMAFDAVGKDDIVVDIGSGPGYMAKELMGKTEFIYSYDQEMTEELQFYSKEATQVDLDKLAVWQLPDRANVILMLDILEFLDSPERLLRLIREKYAQQQPKVLVSTANVAYFLTRFSLFFGKFNYGRLGILEMNKKRLFTRNSILRLLKDEGYTILRKRGIPAPFHKAMPRIPWLATVFQKINQALIWLLPGLFSYQIFIETLPGLTLSQLLENARTSREETHSDDPQ